MIIKNGKNFIIIPSSIFVRKGIKPITFLNKINNTNKKYSIKIIHY